MGDGPACHLPSAGAGSLHPGLTQFFDVPLSRTPDLSCQSSQKVQRRLHSSCCLPVAVASWVDAGHSVETGRVPRVCEVQLQPHVTTLFLPRLAAQPW